MTAVQALPPPPPASNYYAGPEEQSDWGMLGNDAVGDCVEAAVLHLAKVHASYADAPVEPTEAEAIAAYETQGYVPGQPDTDQGSVMLGPDGIMQRWLTHGFTVGGRLSRIEGFVQIRPKVLEDWRLGLHYCNGLLLGIDLPDGVDAAATDQDATLDTASKPILGGNEDEVGRKKAAAAKAAKQKGLKESMRNKFTHTQGEG